MIKKIFLFHFLYSCIPDNYVKESSLPTYDFNTHADIQKSFAGFPNTSRLNILNNKLDYFHKQNSINILFSSPEFLSTKIGGVGAVSDGILEIIGDSYIQGKKIEPFFIFPYYAFISTKVEYIGSVTHLYKHNIVNSSLYLSLENQNGKKIPTFYVKPNSTTYSSLFEIKDYKQIFSLNNRDTDYSSRILYFNSAIVSFIQNLKHHDNQFYFDIFHGHTYFTSMVSVLCNSFYKRHPIIINHIHTIDFDQGKFKYAKWGNSIMNFSTLALAYSDADILVSKNSLWKSLQNGQENDIGIFYRQSMKKRKLFVVSNGITFDKINPFITGNLKTSLSNTDYMFTTDIIESKEKIKKEILFEKKRWLSEPTRPLFVFIGRYAHDKGIDRLDFFISQILKRGGACIIMGIATEKTDAALLTHLKEKYQHLENIHIMDGDPHVEQFSSENMGNLIRAASDFLISPSHDESFGLTPIELLGVGTIPITSLVGGFRENFHEMAIESLSIGNSFNYDEEKNKKLNFPEEKIQIEIQKAIGKAFLYYEINKTERNKVSLRLIKEAKNSDWKTGESITMLKNVYETLLNHQHTGL